MFNGRMSGLIKGSESVQEYMGAVCKDNGQGRHEAGIENVQWKVCISLHLACITADTASYLKLLTYPACTF